MKLVAIEIPHLRKGRRSSLQHPRSEDSSALSLHVLSSQIATFLSHPQLKFSMPKLSASSPGYVSLPFCSISVTGTQSTNWSLGTVTQFCLCGCLLPLPPPHLLTLFFFIWKFDHISPLLKIKCPPSHIPQYQSSNSLAQHINPSAPSSFISGQSLSSHVTAR